MWGDTIFLSFKVTKEKLGYVIITDVMIQVDISGGTLYNRVPTAQPGEEAHGRQEARQEKGRHEGHGL